MSAAELAKLLRGEGEPITRVHCFPHAGAVLMPLPQSIECPKCHRSVRLVVNRGGTTVCLGCDDAVQTSAGAAAE